ncbi:hypothetical protein [Endozoicomonas sp. SESOKO4]|uniref:hypothetical protein n=2 Tax=Endozoicomonas TaxID=305899 RepID=UPI002147E993|nr:hypothetical protein [Endozoicomonas sp. SESOKO4]
MFRHSLFTALLLILLLILLLSLLLSVVCQAEPWTEHFIVEIEQKAAFPNQSFSIKRARHTLTGNPSDIADPNNYAGIDSTPDDQSGYGVKKNLIVSISWQWLYATHLLMGYELILTNKDAPLSAKPYSWLIAEVLVSVGWLLKSYYKNLLSFSSFGRQEATSMLTRRDNPFTYINMVLGSGHNQQSQSLSESFGKRVSGAKPQLTGTFISPMHSDSADGNRSPQQPQHTLDLNCFISPCRGVCCFRSPIVDRELAEWPLNSEESSTDNPTRSISAEAVYTTEPPGPHNYAVTMHRNLPITSDDWIIIHGLLNLHKQRLPEETETSFSHTHFTPSMGTSPLVCLASRRGTLCQKVLSNLNRGGHTGEQTCDEKVVGEDGQKQSCSRVCKNVNALLYHKRKEHTGPQTCDLTLVTKDGQQLPCEKVYKSVRALEDHKRRDHATGQKTCNVAVFTENGQLRSCGQVCRSTKALSDHRNRTHSGQQTCDVTVVTEDHQQRPCGTVCKNTKALWSHKSREHSGQKNCDITLVGEDGRTQPCGTVCKSAHALRIHKNKVHGQQQTCNATIIGADGQPRPCGQVCNSIPNLSVHKSRYHSGQKICDVTVVGEDGLQRPCGKVCNNAQVLYNHKRYHQKRKPVDVVQDDDSGL